MYLLNKVYVILQQLSEMVADFQKSYKKCVYYLYLCNFVLRSSLKHVDLYFMHNI